MEVSPEIPEETSVLKFDSEIFEGRIDQKSRLIKSRPKKIVNWCRRYRPVWLNPERPDMRDRPNHIKKWLDHFASHRRALIIGPPGHGKSWVGQDACIWKIANNRNTKGVWVSKTEREAIKAVTAIRDDLETNKRLIRDYGPFYRRGSWGSQKFKIQRPLRGALDKEMTLQAAGINGQIEGMRLNFAVLDDIVDFGSLMYAREREIAIEWLKNTLFARLDPGAVIWVIGSRWHYGDVYGFLKGRRKQFPRESIIETKAILDFEQKRVLGPEMCDWNYLMDQKDLLGGDRFNLRYQQMAALRENAPFPDIASISLAEILEKGFWFRFAGADWNASEKESSNLSALMFVDLLLDGTMVISAGFSSHLKQGYREWIRKCLRHATMPGSSVEGFPDPCMIASESIAFQEVVSRQLEEYDPQKGFLGVPIKRIRTKRKKDDKTQKYERIVSGMAPWIEANKLRIYKEGPGMEDIAFDLIGFPDIPFYDRLDALERAVYEAVDVIKRNESKHRRMPVIR